MLFNYQIIDDKITLFYSLKTGKIKCYCTGVQDMEYFGEDKEDYNYGVLVVENDNYITQNLDKFIVEDDELILLAQPPSTRYKIK